jgi:hypothetical protein
LEEHDFGGHAKNAPSDRGKIVSLAKLGRSSAAPLHKNNSVAGDFGVDLGGPAIYAACHGFGVSNALGAKPVGYILATHAVVAIEDDIYIGIEFLKIRGNGAHGNEFGALDTALRMLPRLSNIDEQNFFAAINTRFYFLWCDFEIIHR